MHLKPDTLKNFLENISIPIGIKHRVNSRFGPIYRNATLCLCHISFFCLQLDVSVFTSRQSLLCSP